MRTKEDILSSIVKHLLHESDVLFSYDEHSSIGNTLLTIINDIQDLRD